MFDLLGERAHAFEFAGCGCESVALFRHRFGDGQKLLLDVLERSGNALGDSGRNTLLRPSRRNCDQH